MDHADRETTTPGRRPGRARSAVVAAALAVILAASGTASVSATTHATAATTAAVPPDVDLAGMFPYRARHFDLQDLCREGLPWTRDDPLPFPVKKPRDKYGVPMYRVDGKNYYRPGGLALNGMLRLDAWIDTGHKRQLTQALLQADRLRLELLRRRKASWVPFWFDYPPAGQRAPWFNAMAQGLVLSFFVRLYRETGDRVHMDAAHKVFKAFLRLRNDKRTWFAYADAGHYLWLEHYPKRLPDHVLNAHIHAIIGVYEYWQATRLPAARKVLEGSLTTMRDHAWRYRRKGGLSIYGLKSRTQIRKYHEIHIWQFRVLANISGDDYFARLARKLKRDVKPVGHVQGRPAVSGWKATAPNCRLGPVS